MKPLLSRMDANGNFYHSYPDKLDASHSTINTGIRGRARGSSFGSNASTSITVPSTASYDSGYSTDTPQQHMYVPRQPNPLPSASLQQLTDQRAGPKSDLDALIGALSSVENGHVNLVSDWPGEMASFGCSGIRELTLNGLKHSTSSPISSLLPRTERIRQLHRRTRSAEETASMTVQSKCLRTSRLPTQLWETCMAVVVLTRTRSMAIRNCSRRNQRSAFIAARQSHTCSAM